MPDKHAKPGQTRPSDASKARAIACLLTASSIEGAAADAGVSGRSISRWIAEDAEFRRELAEARAAMFNHALMHLQSIAEKSVKVMAGLLSSRNERIRLEAARGIITLSIKAREAIELDERIRRLENIIEGEKA